MFWKDFKKSTGEQVIGALLVIAIFVLQIHYGIIKRGDIQPNARSIAWPYISLLCVFFLVHLIRAPWKMNEAHESRHAEYSIKRAELEFDIASLNQRLTRALEEPSGPEIMLWFWPDALWNDETSLQVENLRGGTACRVKIQDADHCGLVLTVEEIPFIKEGRRETCCVKVVCARFPSEKFTLRGFANPPPSQRHLSKDKRVEIPINVSYWDANGKEFEARFVMTFDRITMKVAVRPLSRKIVSL